MESKKEEGLLNLIGTDLSDIIDDDDIPQTMSDVRLQYLDRKDIEYLASDIYAYKVLDPDCNTIRFKADAIAAWKKGAPALSVWDFLLMLLLLAIGGLAVYCFIVGALYSLSII